MFVVDFIEILQLISSVNLLLSEFIKKYPGPYYLK